MNNFLYQCGISLVKKRKIHLTGDPFGTSFQRALERILGEERARGGVFCLFDAQNTHTMCFGQAYMKENIPLSPHTHFRIASISKLVTSYCVLRLARENKIDVHKDISDYLQFPVKNPLFPDKVISLYSLLTHTSSIIDSPLYFSSLSNPLPLQALLTKESFAPYAPDNGFCYSNLGAGMIGAVLQSALKTPFDTLVHQTILDPLHIDASFFPQRVKGAIADAYRLFPPVTTPNYNGKNKKNAPPVTAQEENKKSYLLAQGNLIISVPDLVKITQEIVNDKEIFQKMCTSISSFGKRDSALSEGIGMFVYNTPALSSPIYGHQGLAYGAVHGIFLNGKGQGFCICTTAVSEKRQGVITDMNKKIMQLLIKEHIWTE